MAKELHILTTGSYCEIVSGDNPPALKDLVKQSTGVAVRRVSRFVQLALIGAGRCAREWQLPSDCAIYFSSCRGDIDVTAELLDDMIRRNEMPGPLTFVNSVSNAACFHVASVLGLEGRSNFITNRFDPLVAALKSAWVDLARDEIEMALVGSVDVSSWPLEHHRKRVEIEDDRPLAEASHWFLVAKDAQPLQPSLARITAVENFVDWPDLKSWLESRAFESDLMLAPGLHLSESMAQIVEDAAGINQRWRYCESLPHYDSQLGAAIELFIESSHSTMLHVNSDPSGRFSVLLLEK